jgi:hypothetical protein
MGPLLAAQRPDLAIDELETFDISHVTFPVHPGTMAFRRRNDPGFAGARSGTIFEVAVDHRRRVVHLRCSRSCGSCAAVGRGRIDKF